VITATLSSSNILGSEVVWFTLDTQPGEMLYFASVFMEGVALVARRRRIHQNKNAPTSNPRNVTPPTTPPAIAPALEELDVGVEVGTEVAEVDVAVGTGMPEDSGPPRAAKAAVTLNVSPAETSKYA